MNGSTLAHRLLLGIDTHTAKSPRSICRFSFRHGVTTEAAPRAGAESAEAVLARLVARSLLNLDATTVTDLTKTDAQSIITKLALVLDEKQLDQKED